MAIDRQGTGLTVLRICIGVFFIFEGLGKIRWFADTSLLAGQLRELDAGGAARLGQPLVSGTDRGPRRRDFRAARSARRDDVSGSRCCSASGRRCSRSSPSSWR